MKTIKLPQQPMMASNFKNYIATLYYNGLSIELKYIPRAAYCLLMSILTITPRLFEKLLYDNQLENIHILTDPLFIIGHWRSGTTFLHYLMANDHRFGYISSFQTFSPCLSNIGKSLIKPIITMHLPSKRPMDNMDLNINLPQEEEFALGNISQHCYYHAFYFPKRMKEYFKRYILFDSLSKKTIEDWKRNYMYIIKKATLQCKKRQLILKNPANTARIKLILEVFPNAKFIYLYRNPYEVFLSTVRLYEKLMKLMAFHTISKKELINNILEFYPRIVDRFFQDRKYIPKENIIYIQYEKFIKEPYLHLRRIYDKLSLQDFKESEAKFIQYITTQNNYRPYKYNIDKKTRILVDYYWKESFQKHEILQDL